MELKPKEKGKRKLRDYVYYKMTNKHEEQWLLTSGPVNDAITLSSRF
jgi:hypothetical protein